MESGARTDFGFLLKAQSTGFSHSLQVESERKTSRDFWPESPDGWSCHELKRSYGRTEFDRKTGAKFWASQCELTLDH